jgi:hypothetical protein
MMFKSLLWTQALFIAFSIAMTLLVLISDNAARLTAPILCPNGGEVYRDPAPRRDNGISVEFYCFYGDDYHNVTRQFVTFAAAIIITPAVLMIVTVRLQQQR